MKIGFDSKRAFNNRSGLGNYSRFLLSGFADHYPDNEYFLYTPKQSISGFLPIEQNIEIVEPKGIYSKIPSLWRSLHISSLAKKEDLDIYHGLSNELPVAINKSGARSVVTIHDLIFLRFPELYKPIDVKIYNRKFRSACAQADRIVAISEQTKKDIIHYYNINEDKINVIYQDCMPSFHNRVDDKLKKRVKEKYDLPDEFILCVGTIERRKNQLAILKAVANLSLNYPVVIVGRPTDYLNELKEFARKHKLANQVYFIHDANFSDFPAIYQQARVFVYPSIFEGFGIPIIEGLNSGVPVITSTGSCFSEAGGDAPKYIDPRSIEDLSTTIVEVWENEELRSKMIERGHHYVQRFRSSHIVPQYMDVYRSLL